MVQNKNFDFLINELQKIQRFYSYKDYDTVIIKAKALIKKYPNVIPFYNAIGLAYNEKKDLISAKKYFLKAIEINPNDGNVLNNLGLISKEKNEYDEAERYFNKAIKASSKNFVACLNLGNLKREIKQVLPAISLYQKAISINNNIPEIYVALADIHQAQGDYKLAEKYCKILNEKFPNVTEQDIILSKVINYRQDIYHQNLMLNKVKNKEFKVKDKINLNFALGKSFEDQKQFKEAISYITNGNDLMKTNYANYNIQNDEIFFKKIIIEFEKYKKFLLQKNYTFDKRVIFIIGLPRSGTTLLHQIISNDHSVFGAGEMVFFNDGFLKLFSETNQIKNVLDQLEDIRSNFIEELNKFETNKNIICEKTPGNFIWLGFLIYLFPNCKIIHCKRDIKDNALSIYKNLFSSNSYKWSYDKDDLAQYINLYKKIIAYWTSIFGKNIFHNEYLDLINNPIEQTKKIFEFCGLDWEPDILNIEKSTVSIDTLSSVQARKPIYKSSINFYKNYENLTNLFDKIDSFE